MFATSMVFGRFVSANEERRRVRIAGNPGIRTCHPSSVHDKYQPTHRDTFVSHSGRLRELREDHRLHVLDRSVKYGLPTIHSQLLADATALLAGDDDLLYLSCFTCR